MSEITPADYQWPEIEWEITTEVLEEDIDERFISLKALGVDDSGKTYSGIAIYIGGEFQHIEEIELA